MVGLKRRFNLLQEDIKNIDSGRVPLPHYENENKDIIGVGPVMLDNSGLGGGLANGGDAGLCTLFTHTQRTHT